MVSSRSTKVRGQDIFRADSPPGSEVAPMPVTYDADIVAWAEEQAALLRAGKFSALDIEHIADEVEDVGKSEKRELANRMSVLLAHLLKWREQVLDQDFLPE